MGKFVLYHHPDGDRLALIVAIKEADDTHDKRYVLLEFDVDAEKTVWHNAQESEIAAL